MEQHELSIEQHQHSRLMTCASIYRSHEMDCQEIVSWYSSVGMILRSILLAKGILQHVPLGTENDGGLR